MSELPQPPSSLDNSCTVINDNTLYSYSPDGFVSIRFDEGEEWEELSMGVPVTGAACVGSASGFFVVGGTGGDVDYSGLQRFDYASKEWATVTSSGAVQVLKNRQFHGAAYIPAVDRILVYAGTTSGAQARSEETFTIGASEPFTIDGYNSAGAPTTIKPILLNWSGADVLMVGGDAANTQVWLFNPTAGWRNFGATLAEPLAKDTTLMQAALFTGEDGSQNLYVFDLSVSPNFASRVVLSDANGTPVQNSARITKRQAPGGDFPSYNSTLAPTITRSNFAIAQGADGMVVFSGGNAQEPLSIFDASENSWLDPEDILLEEDITTTSSRTSSTRSSTRSSSRTSTISSSSSTPSSSSSSSSSSTTPTPLSTSAERTAVSSTGIALPTDTGSSGIAANDDRDSGIDTMTILGITLGSIFGFIIILAVILFCLRRKRKGQNSGSAATSPDSEKNPNTYANIISNPPPSPGNYRSHRPQPSAESFSSVAILMGRMNQQKPGLTRKASNETGRSSGSSFHKQFKSKIGKPVPQGGKQATFSANNDKGVAFDPAVRDPQPRPRNGRPEPDDPTRRSSGWNRYWSGGSALQILGFGGAKRNTVASDRSSRYSQATGVMHNPTRATQDSATVPPLNFEGKAEVNSVNSGSPIVTGYPNHVPLKEGMAGKIERPVSRASSGYSSGVPESINDMWGHPGSDDKPWGTERAPSSAYAPSFYGAPQATTTTVTRAPAPTTGVSTQPQLAMAATSTDMSWLNLGEHSRNSQF